jgi:hypothetical protein
MTDLTREIAELRKLCEAATPEWWLDHDNSNGVEVKDGAGNSVHFSDYGGIPSERGSNIHQEVIRDERANARFMIAAREWLPKFLDLAAASLSAGEPDGMETNAGERKAVMEDAAGHGALTVGRSWIKRLLRDFDRLLARETKAKERERQDAIIISRLNSGSELQAVMQLNNALKSALETSVARETKAREEEREAAAERLQQVSRYLRSLAGLMERANLVFENETMMPSFQAHLLDGLIAAIRARTAPDPQSEIGLRAHLADLSARGLKP